MSQQNNYSDINQSDLSVRISNDEKEGLVNFAQNQTGLGKFHLVIGFFIVFLILCVFIPKIFISNNIYYTSREISRLYAEKELLREEKMRLQREIETINNKHLMLELGE